jgi:hypothetical protein
MDIENTTQIPELTPEETDELKTLVNLSPDDMQILNDLESGELSVIKTVDLNQLMENHKSLRSDNNQMRVDLLDSYAIITNVLKIIQVRGIGLLFSIVDFRLITGAVKKMASRNLKKSVGLKNQEEQEPIFTQEESEKMGKNFLNAVNSDETINSYLPRINEIISRYAAMFNDKNKLQ